MTSPGTAVGRGVTAMLLVVAHRTLPAHHAVPSRHARPLDAPVALLTSATVARLGLRRRGVRWRPPPSTIGRLLLGAHVASGVLVEELIWRAPLVHLPPRTRLPAAIGSAAVFAGLHLRRDGPSSAWAHVPNTVSWTAAVLIGGRVRWAAVAHCAYNMVAVCAGPTGEPDPPSGRSGSGRS